jgi:two-component system, OmpR family, sensor histidine kinase BaeS
MRFTIKYKLFLTLLLTTIVVVASMVFLVKWSFERGFLEYVNRVEQEMHNNLVTNLADAYKGKGSWDFLKEDPRQWKDIHRSSIPIPALGEGREEARQQFRPRQRAEKDGPESLSNRPHRKPPFGKRRGGRDCLLDENKIAITRCRSPESEMKLKNIVVDEQIVGYLAISPRKKLSERHDLQFSQQQHRFLLILGFCIVLISAVVAFPVSRQLVKPINKLTGATRKLAAGEYQSRVNVGSSDELGDLSRDFNTLAMTLENNEQARQQWIADISHELRTPLSVLRAEIEALQDGVRQMTPERLNSLHSEVMNLNRLVNDLYELSMSDIGALNYQKQLIDVSETLNKTLESHQDEFDSKNITVAFEPDSKPRQINADPERLQQLFSNLLINTLRYTDAGGKLEIKLDRDKSRVLIIFEDSAPGVPDDDIPHLFERLYRVESSRNRETGGTGLGLAICKNIVEAHEGNIVAETSTLGGLKITIDLPVV